MTLTEVLKIIDQLTPEQRVQVRQYINEQAKTPLQEDIETILKTAKPTDLPSGTLDEKPFLLAIQGMWQGLEDDAIADIIATMNDETIPNYHASFTGCIGYE